MLKDAWLRTLRNSAGGACLSDAVEPVGEPRTRNLHVQFDEREVETEHVGCIAALPENPATNGEHQSQPTTPVDFITCPPMPCSIEVLSEETHPLAT